MSNLPWSKFYWADWSRDANLRACSYAAKGLWMDMLCHMDASPEKGFLLVGERAATNAEIAKIIGGERRLVERLLVELEANGVFSRDARNAVFSRRMTRDCVKSRENSANGKLGGNPVLIKTKDLAVKPLKAGVKPRVKAEADTEADTEKESTLSGAKESDPIAPKALRQTGMRLPDDWTPGHVGWDFAVSLNLNPKAVLNRFRDHWKSQPGKAGRKADWLATWRNWCRTDAQRSGMLPLAPPPGPRRPTPTTGSPF